MSVLSVADPDSGRHGQSDSADAPALSALPKITRRRKGLLGGIILLLLIALGAVLTVNIHVANSQYQVVQMQNDYEALMHENEALNQQVQFRNSPQTLSEAAVSLGMVMPASAGTLNLEASELVSSAEPASSDERPSNFVSAPTGSETDPTAAVDVAEQAEGAPTGLLGVGALHTLSAPDAGQNGSGSEQAPEPAADDRLPGGGTIPAPGLN